MTSVIEQTVDHPPHVKNLPQGNPPTRHLPDGIPHLASDSSHPTSSDVSTSKSVLLHYRSATVTPSCDKEQGGAGTAPETFRNFRTQSQLDFKFAQQMYDEEKIRAEEEDYNLARAQQLADRWAEEERRKAASEAKDKSRKEFAETQRLADARARREHIKRDNEERYAREAARSKRENAGDTKRKEEAAAQVRTLAQRTEALTKAAAALSGDERRRRYVPDDIRIAALNFKTERKAKLQREREYAEEVHQRHRVQRDFSKKRYEKDTPPVIPLQRVPRPYQQTYSSQQRASRARSQQTSTPGDHRRATPTRSYRSTPFRIECVSCMEPGDQARMTVIP